MVMKSSIFNSSLAYALTLIVGSVSSAHAAPGDVAQAPLFLINSSAPNVLFVNDDSGSMDEEMLTTDHTHGGRFTNTQPDGSNPDPTGSGSVIHRGTCDFSSNSGTTTGYIYIVQFASNSKDPDDVCNVADDLAWRPRNSDFNALYFDPTKTYQHWAGVDNSGNPYDQADINHAPDNPYNPQAYINLTTQNAVGTVDNLGFRYYTWTDTDDDGRFDNGEETEHLIKDQSAAIQNNFANWFTYHRKREFVAKYAISSVINDTSGVRMGLATINNSSSLSVQASSADKSALLSAVQQVDSSGMTPLVSALNEAGQYYSNSSTGPILPADEGGACQRNNTILMTDGYYTDGSSSSNLASVAAQYYDNDLLPSPYDGTQRMNTYSIAFGVNGTLDPFDTVTPGDLSDTDPTNASFVGWPDPTASDAAKIDDLWRAAYDSDGLFLNADNSDELVEALSAAVGDGLDQVQSATSVAMSAFRLEEDSLVFFSRFNSETWSGELVAHSINADGGINTAETWNAATELDDNNSRNIFTYSNNNGISFEWTDSLSDSMKAALTHGDTAAGIGEARLNYLRGETNNSFGFRQRDSILGDTVNSSPVFVGAPASPYPGEAYFNFWDDNKDRTKILYVGANDGMLHGFNANTGEELLAYVPATVFANLHKLTDPNYKHHNFVDASPTVSDAFFESSWHTVLTGTLGAGGKGLFALDITDPDNFDASKVLWEFSAADDLDATDPTDLSDLGYTFSQATLVRIDDGSSSGRWAVIAGNGYDSDSGIAKLLIIYLDADLSDGKWDEGSGAGFDYYKISTAVGSPDDKNGLSTPTAVDSDGDGYVDRVYAGDLKGNMWAFDLENGSTPYTLFQAKNDDNVAQPITVKPSVIRHPTQSTLSSNSPNLMVLFGTGQYVNKEDLINKQTQSFYGVWDKGQAIEIASDEKRTTKLVEQVITEDTGIRVTSKNPIPYGNTDSTQRFGWFVDLHTTNANSGERVVSKAVVINDVVFFTTYIPNMDPCGIGGESWFMFLNAVDGAFPDEPVININSDSLVDDDDKVNLQGGDAEATAPSGLKIEGTLGSPSLDLGDSDGNGSALLNTANGIENIATNVGSNTRGKRVSWRELRQQ